MTTVYFIRHAQSDNSVHDDRIRPLTDKGMNDRAFVTEFLRGRQIDAVLSSPFKRAVDTVADFAGKYGFDDFMEMVNIMPWVVIAKYDGKHLVGMWKIDVFEPSKSSVWRFI